MRTCAPARTRSSSLPPRMSAFREFAHAPERDRRGAPGAGSSSGNPARKRARELSGRPRPVAPGFSVERLGAGKTVRARPHGGRDCGRSGVGRRPRGRRARAACFMRLGGSDPQRPRRGSTTRPVEERPDFGCAHGLATSTVTREMMVAQMPTRGLIRPQSHSQWLSR